jgi:putative flippase GtrA
MAKDRKELWRAIKFGVISLSAGIIDFVSFELLNAFVFGPKMVAYSTYISIILSVIWNFTINRKVTFKSSNNIVKSMILVALFYVAFIPASGEFMKWAIGIGIDESIAKLLSMVANMVLEYLFTRFVVYRNSCDTAEQK